MKFYKRLQAALLAGMMACTVTAASLPSMNSLTAQAVDTNNDDWLHAVGSRLYDKDGNEVWLTGANWFGFNCGEKTVCTICGVPMWMTCFRKLQTVV